MAKTFSVVIPVFNRIRSLERVVDALKSQTFSDFEVIVVDDGSDTDVSKAVSSLGFDKIRVYRQENAGPAAARNYGSKQSVADYLIFLDSDDVPHTDWLMALGAQLPADIIFSGYDIYHDEVLTKRFIDFNREELLGQKATFLAGTFAIRRHMFDSIGGYDEKLWFSENFELGMRVCRLQNLKMRYVNSAKIDIRFEGVVKRLRKHNVRKAQAILYLLRKHRDIFKRNPRALKNHYKVLAFTFYSSGRFRWAAKVNRRILSQYGLDAKVLVYMLLSHTRAFLKI